ncbi:MAG TPA: NlpC/P60 family protein [Micromonosporaceae bacterium]
MLAAPGYADPVGAGAVPDDGAPPIASGAIALPGSGGTSVAAPNPPVVGPLAQQIAAEQAAVELLGEQLKQRDADVARAHDAAQRSYQAWQQALAQVQDLTARAKAAADEAYKAATALGPFGSYASELHELGVLAPGLTGPDLSGPDGADALGRALARARQQEELTRSAYQTASANETNVTAQRDTLRATFDKRSAALTDLRTRNRQQLAAAEAERERYDQSLAGKLGVGTNVDGLAPNPKALAAVQFALRQLGKPYVWATEGPDTYDCSGLTWASYHSVGVDLPRIANEQQHETTPVPDVSKLLPGDLLFFATDRNDWHTIHHVAIYLGDGKMVHAPTTGDVVKISPIWWSEFFGATRVVPAVPAPHTGPTGHPGNHGGGTPTPTPSKSPTPTPTPTTTPTTPPTTPPSSTTPTPTPTSPSPTSPSPSVSSASPSDSASTSPSQQAATQTPATDPSGSAG